VTGRLAVRLAKLLGAGRVVGAGRNPEGLRSLLQLGADATIRLDTPDNELRESFLWEAGASGFQVVSDYLWGHATEVFLSSITSKPSAAIGTETRLVQVGETAGPNIAFPAVVLRSTALTVLGTAGIPSLDILNAAFRKVMNYAAAADLSGGNH
jgi:NADPH:quinone reductase-like Zn-dependent oxidoreductase